MKVKPPVNLIEPSFPVTDELKFLKQQTGEDETSILIKALHLGLNVLYCQMVEQLFINGSLPREKAEEILGQARVEEIEYARQALAQDVVQGLHL